MRKIEVQRYGDELPFKGIVMDQTEFAEQTGYLTTRQLVERFMDAGVKLSGYRKGLLDSDAEDDSEQEAADIYDFDEPTSLDARVKRTEAKMRELWKAHEHKNNKTSESGTAGLPAVPDSEVDKKDVTEE